MSKEPPREQTKPPPIAPDERKHILKLHEAGYGTRKIARSVGRNRKTVQRVLQEEGIKTRPQPLESSTPESPKPKRSKLDPFRELVKQKVALRLTTKRILREIRELGYTGGRTILAKLCRSLRKEQRPHKRAKRRFETPPGKELQIDWSPYIVEIGGRKTTVHAFSATMCHSRKKHIRFYLDERESTLLEAHLKAFEDFGGTATRHVYDRMSTVVLGQIGRSSEPVWHPRFLDFKEYYGFDAYLCKRADPDRKGKVERPFRHLEVDFLRGSTFDSLQDLNERARWWLDQVANGEPHGTTGRVPDEAFLEERDLLIQLPDIPYVGCCDEEGRLVDEDATISVRGTCYTIPPEHASSTVTVRLYSEDFSVLDTLGRLVMRRRYVDPSEKGRLQIDPAHYAPQGPSFSRSRVELHEAFVHRFPILLPLLEGLQRRMKSLAHIHVRALLRLAATYGEAAFLSAATRAQAYRRFDATAVRRILERDFPLPPDEPLPSLTATARVNQLLGDVDGGSLDCFADLDTLPPAETSAKPCEDEEHTSEEAGHGEE